MKTSFSIKLATLLLFVMHTLYVSGQLNYSNAVEKYAPTFLQSPNAASLGQYGPIDVSPFTGLPSIGIPLFSVSEGDIPITASLSYMGGGVKTEEHPSWVGQNWTLNVGGVVTRKRNGGVDEVAVPNFIDTTSFSYYFKCVNLNTSSWNTASFVQSYMPNHTVEGVTICDYEPDEFFFNLPDGQNGSFFRNHLGEWQVKSRAPGGFRVSVSLATNFQLKYVFDSSKYSTLRRIIYAITITDGNGVKYTFGNDPKAVEFIRGPIAAVTQYNENIVANAWQLTRIESPKGYVVNLKYQRKQHLYVQDVTYSKIAYQTTSLLNSSYNINFSGSSSSPFLYGSNVVTPSYLSEISGSTFRIAFSIDTSSELRYPYQNSVANNTGTTVPSLDNYPYEDMGYIHHSSSQPLGEYLLADRPPKWYELKEIQVYDGYNNLRKVFAFNYNNIATKRLFLQGVVFRNFEDGLLLINGLHAPTSRDYSYGFSYDTTVQMPAYNAMAVDEWGYYNGNPFPFPIGTTSMSPQQLKGYYAANIGYAKAGILTRVTYPTGGTSDFAYEMNDYSGVVKKDSLGNVSVSPESGSGGGLRIKRITTTPLFGVPSIVEYQYRKGSTGQSSGVLAGHKTLLYTARFGNPLLATADILSNNSNSDLNYTNGRDVTYSEVRESFSDGSYSLYKYSNMDSIPYKDETPGTPSNDIYVGKLSDPRNDSWSPAPVSSRQNPFPPNVSREMERGLLLSKTTYNSSGLLVYKEENSYRNDAARFNEYVRGYGSFTYNLIQPGSGMLSERTVQPLKHYTYYPYLRSKTVTRYDASGSNPFTVTSYYRYDNTNRLLRSDSTVDSRSATVAVAYRYPVDSLSVPLYASMNQAGMVLPAIDRIKTRAGQQVLLAHTSYGTFSGHFLPSLESLKNGALPVEVRQTYSQYDGKGNIREVVGDGNKKTVYLWGYRGKYPVLKVEGSSYEAVAALVNQALLDSAASYTDEAIRVELNKVRTGLAGTTAQVWTYTFLPLYGMSSETDPRGYTVFYSYDGFGRLLNVKDRDGKILKSMDYHYQSQTF